MGAALDSAGLRLIKLALTEAQRPEIIGGILLKYLPTGLTAPS